VDGQTSKTSSERYLTRLCRRSFLRLWSWPNIYRDQHWGGSALGKEVCDLLVVFGNHVFIFSDKDCTFPDTGDLRIDWTRWVKRAVLKSAKQVAGAEKWIRDYPDRLYLDAACAKPSLSHCRRPGRPYFTASSLHMARGRDVRELWAGPEV